jgi:hypothetical protein
MVPTARLPRSKLIEFATQAGYAAFVADGRRAALAAPRDAAIAHTGIFRG